MASKKGILEKIKIPKETTIAIGEGIVAVKGPKGEAKKKLLHPRVELKVENDEIIITAKKQSKREKKLIGTFKAHIRNMFKGVSEGHKYTLKICAGHFPIDVSAEKCAFTVKNFFGERVPRTMRIKEGVSVKVEGDLVIVESLSKEAAGQVAADIEQLVRRPGYDTRIFQDGIYIINKDGKEIK